MTIGERIRGLREDRDMTQTQIANLLNTSQTVYSRYERNERLLPTDLLIILCRFYKVSADYILGLSNERSRAEK